LLAGKNHLRFLAPKGIGCGWQRTQI